MTIIIFILGTIVGSFLNVFIYRIPRKEGLTFPSFHCSKCFKPLKWYELIPILSFFIQGGKCRYCKERVTLQYPFVEILNGFTYLTLYNYFGVGLQFVFYAIIIDILIIISFIDYNFRIIPSKLNILLLISTFIYKLFQFLLYDISPYFLNSIIGLIASSGIFLLLFIISKGGVGGGDIKLMGVLGFILGAELSFLNMFLSFFIGAIASILLIVLKIKRRKDSIPFAPFISIAFMITILWGRDIIYWYFTTLF